MFFSPEPINLGMALLNWLIAMGLCAAVGFVVAFVLSFAVAGAAGPAKLAKAIPVGIADLFGMAPRRIGAIASLTAKESIRRQDILVGVVFVLLFMFAGWFLQSTNVDTPAKPYISFVLTAIRWLILPVALLLSCWGLPADIKVRSLHTVVTKPARRSEVVLGRMLGYGAVMTLGVVVMGLVGYVWIYRSVPVDARRQLVSRVPVYGNLRFINRYGEETDQGINVGDVWTFRSFIEGNTAGRAIFTFQGVDRMKNDEGLTLEYRFELFRSHKGEIEQSVLGQFELINEAKGLTVPYPQVPFQVREFADTQTRTSKEGGREPVLTIPRKLPHPTAGGPQTVDLFDDLVGEDGSLVIAMRCVDQGQYLGAARTDLFIRLPDRNFAVGYFKAILGTWLMAILVIILGTTASTFVKGPVATLLTFTLILTGLTMRPFMDKLVSDYLLQQQGQGHVLGGGMLESAYRMVMQENMQTPLPEGTGTDIIKFIDARVFDGLVVLRNVVPNFTYFDMTPYVANGFDVDWNASLFPSILLTLGFLIPCVVLGYFSLQLRELEAK